MIFLPKRVRHLYRLAGLMACAVCINANAAHLIATLEPVKDQPSVQTLIFSDDLMSLGLGDIIEVPIEPVVTFTITEIDVTADSSRSIIAQSSRGFSSLMLSIKDGAVYGSIIGESSGIAQNSDYEVPNIRRFNYTVSTDKELGLILVDHKHSGMVEIDLSGDAMIPPDKRPDLPGMLQMTPVKKQQLNTLMAEDSSRRQANKSSEDSEITMLIIYSGEFAEGFSSPTARINDLLNFTNASLQASDIKINFVLARAQQLDFDNSLTTNTILSQVTSGSGAFAGVGALRNQVGADMVAVLAFANNFSANGVAWVNGDNADFAYSVTRLSPRCCNSVFAHELGHNLGSGHERASVNDRGDPCSSFNFTGFSCGHGNADRNWGTIMSRLNSQIVGNVFSNPLSQNCLGEPCGIPQGQANAADNTRSFNISRLLVTNFRQDPVSVGPSAPSPNSNPRPEMNTITPILGLLLDEED